MTRPVADIIAEHRARNFHADYSASFIAATLRKLERLETAKSKLAPGYRSALRDLGWLS